MALKRIALTAALIGMASQSHAAQPVATLACAANGANISLNLSYYDVAAAKRAIDGHEWPGAGTPVQTLTVNAGLSSFQTLFQSATAGTIMATCTLSTVASNGDAVQFVMKSVQVKSVSAMASAANVASPATSFVNAVLEFATVNIIDSGGGTDDGGASPIGGWDITTNQKV